MKINDKAVDKAIKAVQKAWRMRAAAEEAVAVAESRLRAMWEKANHG